VKIIFTGVLSIVEW